MGLLEPKTPEGREALLKRGLAPQTYNVCWRCGNGGHNRTTLYWVGAKEGRSIYGCQVHRGLKGQIG